MSDSARGHGWWQAADGRWYPPELHPHYVPPPPPAMYRAVQNSPDMGNPRPPLLPPIPTLGQPNRPTQPKRRRRWIRWISLTAAAVLGVTAIAALIAPRGNRSSASTPDAAAEASPQAAGTLDEASADDALQPPADAKASESATSDEEPSVEAVSADQSLSSEPAVSEPAVSEPAVSEPAVSEPAVSEPAVGSRDLPVPVGQSATITLDAFGDADDSVWTITVDGPGSDITQQIAEANQFNEPPADGRLFYGVPVTLTLNAANKEPLSVFFNLALEYFGPSSLSIIADRSAEGCGEVPNAVDELKEVFVGGSVSGMVCYSVTAEDADGGILLTSDDVTGDRLFMATR